SQVAFLSLQGLPDTLKTDVQGAVMTARALSLIWFALVVIYGILIPNTGRRCAVVVGLMALCPVTLNTVAGLRDPAIEARLLAQFLIQTVAIMAMAAALAIYGSHRIEVLRQQAVQARRLGPYQLKERLGAGGMGEVYLAEHVLLKRPCAVKL